MLDTVRSSMSREKRTGLCPCFSALGQGAAVGVLGQPTHWDSPSPLEKHQNGLKFKRGREGPERRHEEAVTNP